MTNQEINQVYWNLPNYGRKSLDLLMKERELEMAADLIRFLSHANGRLQIPFGLVDTWPEIEYDEALEWASWKASLKGGF